MSQSALSDHVVAHMADTTVPPIIVMDKVNKWFGSLHVLRDVSLSVAEKERVVVCGPSGSGKSTMIRCLNRLEAHQEGKIVVDGIELTDDLRSLDIDPARSRHGVPVVQSVPPSDHSGELHAGADLGAQDVEGGRRGTRDELPHPRQDPRAGEEVSRPAFRRAAAACCDRARPVHAPEDHAVRRADLRAGSRDDQGGARRDDRAGASRE